MAKRALMLTVPLEIEDEYADDDETADKLAKTIIEGFNLAVESYASHVADAPHFSVEHTNGTFLSEGDLVKIIEMFTNYATDDLVTGVETLLEDQ